MIWKTQVMLNTLVLYRLLKNVLLFALCVNLNIALSATSEESVDCYPQKFLRQLQSIDGVAAVVNKGVITLSDVQKISKKVAGILAREGKRLPNPDTFQQQLLYQLIHEKLMEQEIVRMDIDISTVQLGHTIDLIALSNNITTEQLEQEVKKTGMSWAEYCRSVREEIRLKHLRQRIINLNVVVKDAEVDAYVKEQLSSTLNIYFPERADSKLKLSQDNSSLKLFNVALAQILVHVPEDSSELHTEILKDKAEFFLNYLKKGGSFSTLAMNGSDGPEALQEGNMGTRPLNRWPDLFSKAIVDLKPGQITSILHSNKGFHILKVLGRDETIQKSSSLHQPRIVDQTRVCHILVKASPIMENGRTYEYLETLRSRIMNGSETFPELARKHSEDTSAPQGGDIGWISPGEAVEAFETTMNNLEVDEISQPILTSFGWHLIQVKERRKEDISNELQRVQAYRELFHRKSKEAFKEWLEKLYSHSYIENRLLGKENI